MIMSTGGRPPLGPGIVENLAGNAESKRRLRVILEVIAKEKTVEAACRELGIERARFYQLERAALEGALESLEPRRPGPPPAPAPSEADLEVERLKKKLQEEELETQIARAREEVAITMPHLLHEGEGREKKRPPWKRKKPW